MVLWEPVSVEQTGPVAGSCTQPCQGCPQGRQSVQCSPPGSRPRDPSPAGRAGSASPHHGIPLYQTDGWAESASKNKVVKCLLFHCFKIYLNIPSNQTLGCPDCLLSDHIKYTLFYVNNICHMFFYLYCCCFAFPQQWWLVYCIYLRNKMHIRYPNSPLSTCQVLSS